MYNTIATVSTLGCILTQQFTKPPLPLTRYNSVCGKLALLVNCFYWH